MISSRKALLLICVGHLLLDGSCNEASKSSAEEGLSDFDTLEVESLRGNKIKSMKEPRELFWGPYQYQIGKPIKTRSRSEATENHWNNKKMETRSWNEGQRRPKSPHSNWMSKPKKKKWVERPPKKTFAAPESRWEEGPSMGGKWEPPGSNGGSKLKPNNAQPVEKNWNSSDKESVPTYDDVPTDNERWWDSPSENNKKYRRRRRRPSPCPLSYTNTYTYCSVYHRVRRRNVESQQG